MDIRPVSVVLGKDGGSAPRNGHSPFHKEVDWSVGMTFDQFDFPRSCRTTISSVLVIHVTSISPYELSLHL